MLGWVTWGADRKAVLARTRLLGLSLWKLELPAPGRGWEKRAVKGLRQLAAQRVTRVLTPPAFGWWPVLTREGLRPVETRSLRCMLVPDWVKAAVKLAGLPPRQAVICLSSERQTPDMELTAHRLCPVVRNLMLDVPGGETLAARLRREYGMPVLPTRSGKADLTVRFADGPMLEGASFVWKGGQLPADCERLPLLSALWECGRVKTEDIAILV